MTLTNFERGYATWEELIEEDTNGWVVAIVMKEKKKVFTRVTGPFSTKSDARVKAAEFRKTLRKRDSDTPELLGVFVEPLWKSLNFDGN